MNKQILDYLIQLGLNEVEAAVYLYLLENGPKSLLELSRETNIDRAKIYRHVEKLIQKKLIEESGAGWGKKIKASSPKNLVLMITEKEEQLQAQKAALPNVLESLKDLPTYVQREFEINHYHGTDGLKQMLWNQLAAKKEILAFSYKNKNDIAGKPFAEKIRQEQVLRKIMLHEIENETDQGDFWYTNVPGFDKFLKSKYISPQILEIKQYIAIFNNTVSIMYWLNEEKVGIEIVNSIYADMQRQIFWKFWEIAEGSSKLQVRSSKS